MGGGKPIRILEQRFEYDLIGIRQMLWKSLGRDVQLITGEAELVSGELLSLHGNTVVLRTASGIRAMPLDGQMSIRLDDVPDRLFVKPTLIWDIAPYPSDSAAVELSYLTREMGWRADYTCILNENGTTIALDAWVTVDNQSGASFPDVQLQLVAGELHQAERNTGSLQMARAPMAESVSADGAGFVERSLFEYHLYAMERAVTLERYQSKQLALFPPVRLKSQKIYRYDARKDPDSVEARIRFQNESASASGRPLPAGVVRIYQQDGSQLSWVGEDRIGHTPVDAKVEIAAGKAFDLIVEKKVIARTQLSNRSERQEIEIELQSAKKENVEILVDEYFHRQQWKIVESNFDHTKKKADLAEFRVPVEAGKKIRLAYTVVFSW
jgi:hypothetical protein